MHDSCMNETLYTNEKIAMLRKLWDISCWRSLQQSNIYRRWDINIVAHEGVQARGKLYVAYAETTPRVVTLHYSMRNKAPIIEGRLQSSRHKG